MRVIVINELDLKGEFDKILAGVEEGLDIAAQEVQAKFLAPTQSWKNKPEFDIQSEPKKRTVGTNDENYARINDGTKPHEIQSKQGHRLKIQERSPKTRPFSFDSQSGGEGQVYFAKKVKNPGISPRGWDELIEYEYSGEYNNGGRLAEIIQEVINKQ